MIDPASSLTAIWAKSPARVSTSDGRDAAGQPWLNLVQHSRDTADVGLRLADDWLAPCVQGRLASSLGVDGDWSGARAILGWFAGCHDAGKLEMAFQSQLYGRRVGNDLSERVLELPETVGLRPDVAYREPHSLYSELIQRRWMRARFPGSEPSAIASVAAIAGTHHGFPSGLPFGDTRRYNSQLDRAEAWLDNHGDAWAQLWWQLLDDIAERTGSLDALGSLLRSGGVPVGDQILLSGFVSMCDWIASNQDLFPLSPNGWFPDDEARADFGLESLNLTSRWRPQAVEALDFRQRFAWPADAQLRPIQQAAIDIASTVSGPTMMIVQDEVGRGKTEAALLAGEVIAQRVGAGGLAFALPTMTTTDAMLPRLKAWTSNLFDGSVRHSLRLMHSRAELNADFNALVEANWKVNDAEADRGGEENFASDTVIAHAWFSGRKGVLSEFLVCTVDQVLMMALATRYVTMRHLGLAGKVVIIDEVHSYDVYTSDYLARALTWLAAQGASVILLSATLAQGPRHDLVAAYREGLALPKRPGVIGSPTGDKGISLRKSEADRASAPELSILDAPDVAFPRITTVSSHSVQSRHVTAPAERRDVDVSVIDDDLGTLVATVEKLTVAGGVIGIVCNTVRRAQEAVEALSTRFVGQVDLLHSQFTAADRARKEAALVGRLGPTSSTEDGTRPHVRIVVGTSVMEQSLDIDFDALISDIAPMDAIVQRAGRLHRHRRNRPAPLTRAMLFLRAVDLSEEIPAFERGTQIIYGTRVLLATSAVMSKYLGSTPWCIRHDAPLDVECTYSEDLLVPEPWRDAYRDACAAEELKAVEARARAAHFQLLSPERSEGRISKALGKLTSQDVDRKDAEAQAHVRDIEPTLEVCLVQRVGDRVMPLPWLLEPRDAGISLTTMSVPPARMCQVIADSGVRLPKSLVPAHQLGDAIGELEGNGFQVWQRDFRLRGQLILPLDENLNGVIAGKSFRYDPELGIIYRSNSGACPDIKGGPDVPHQ